MRSVQRGRSTLEAEVTNVSPHGFWLFMEDREYFVRFTDFPWFRDATIAQIMKVERPNPDHLYWPALDVDLAVESLEHPERYPLVSRVRTDTSAPAARSRRSPGSRRRR